MNILNKFLNILLLFIIVINIFCSTVFANDYNKYSNEELEQVALQKFRPMIENILTHDYMKEDIYLLKFLREKNLDVRAAAEFLHKAMQWRKENNIDNILNEDFSKVYKHAPYWMNGIDKDGSPILIVNNGRWDIRRYAVNGNRELLTRHWDQMLEKIALKTRELRNSTTSDDDDVGNKEITQAMFIMDIEGYNLRQQGCFACLSIFLEWMSHTENYYPGNFKSLNIINAPRIFSPILEILKPAMSPSTRNILYSYGPNKKEWSELLLQHIPADQLPRQYGGTKKNL